MPYIQDSLTYLIDTLFDLFLYLLVFRFICHLTKANFNNQILITIGKVTQPVVGLFRSFIPAIKGIDIASFVAIIAMVLLKFLLIAFLVKADFTNISFAALLSIALGRTLEMMIWVAMIIILINALLSWFSPSPYNPAVQLINQIATPILTPFRRLLPNMQGIDFSPIVAFLALNLALRLIVAPLMSAAFIG